MKLTLRTYIAIAMIIGAVVAFAASPPGIVRAESAPAVKAAQDKPEYLIRTSTQALEVLQQIDIPAAREFTFTNGNRATADFVERELQDAIVRTITADSSDAVYDPPDIYIPDAVDTGFSYTGNTHGLPPDRLPRGCL